MKTYLLTSPHFTGEIELRFNENGHLIKYDNRAELTEKQFAYMLFRIPVNIDSLSVLTDGNQSKLTEVKIELTFDMFWDKYDYKMGKKARVMKLWEALTETDKQAAMKGIVKYDMYLAGHTKMEKAYPETYLSQRRWENDFR